MNSSKIVCTLSLLAISLLCVGCGPSRPATYPVKGKVVFEDGVVVELGNVEFRSLKHMVTARAKIEKDGSFELTTFEPNDGAVEGTHEVIVQQLVIVEDLSFKQHGHGRRVPPRYADYGKSGLTVEVKPQELNEVTLQLQSSLKASR